MSHADKSIGFRNRRGTPAEAPIVTRRDLRAVHLRSVIVLLGLLAFLAPLAGCKDSRFSKKRQDNWFEAKNTANRLASYDRGTNYQKSGVVGIDRAQRKRQQESLDKALKQIEKNKEQRQADWAGERKKKVAWYRKLFAGKKDEIDDTALKLSN